MARNLLGALLTGAGVLSILVAAIGAVTVR